MRHDTMPTKANAEADELNRLKRREDELLELLKPLQDELAANRQAQAEILCPFRERDIVQDRDGWSYVVISGARMGTRGQVQALTLTLDSNNRLGEEYYIYPEKYTKIGTWEGEL